MLDKYGIGTIVLRGKMTTQIYRDGIEYVSTTIQLPASLRDKAKKAKISFSKTLIKGLQDELIKTDVIK